MKTSTWLYSRLTDLSVFCNVLFLQKRVQVDSANKTAGRFVCLVDQSVFQQHGAALREILAAENVVEKKLLKLIVNICFDSPAEARN